MQTEMERIFHSLFILFIIFWGYYSLGEEIYQIPVRKIEISKKAAHALEFIHNSLNYANESWGYFERPQTIYVVDSIFNGTNVVSALEIKYAPNYLINKVAKNDSEAITLEKWNLTINNFTIESALIPRCDKIADYPDEIEASLSLIPSKTYTWISNSTNLKNPIWTMYLDDTDSRVTLGDNDLVYCHQNMTWTKPVSSGFRLLSVQFNNVSKNITGLPLIEIGFEQNKELVVSKELQQFIFNNTVGEWDKKLNLYKLDCANKSTLGVLEFEIDSDTPENRQMLSIHLSAFVKNKDDVCELSIKSGQKWSMGGELLENHCVAYNMAEEKWGFSAKLTKQTNSNSGAMLAASNPFLSSFFLFASVFLFLI